MADLAYVFVKWNGGDGAGHVAWGFTLPDGRVCIGSVENHSGHLFTPANDMGFWLAFEHAFGLPLRERSYETAAIFEVPSGDAVSAYRVTQWIKKNAYRAATRNCEDDAYDVLRAYGVNDLEAPFFNWFPRWWFSKLQAKKVEIDSLPPAPPQPGNDIVPSLQRMGPLKPVWRKPLHWEFHRLQAAKLFQHR